MFKIITIPFNRNQKGFDDEFLNRFILNKHLQSCNVVFFEDGEDKYWSVFLEYEQVLTEISGSGEDELKGAQKILFDRLRGWRKERAEKDGVPVYIVGTNKELISIVKLAPKSLEALKGVRGFGNRKITMYGEEIIKILKGFYEKP